MTGTHWITETGGLSSPVMLTNTHAVGNVHRGVVDWTVRHRPDVATQWLLPVVAETWDGYLNDINGNHVTAEHATVAIDHAAGGPMAEGSVGGGTGMNCYAFKGGVGTSSRLVTFAGTTYTVGAYVQANFGERSELRLGGVSLGDLDVADPMADPEWFQRDLRRAGVVGETRPASGAGSVIALVATDAPLLPAQCSALARRVPLGLARTGTTGSHFSGDLFLAWSTANAGALGSGFPTDASDADPYRTLRFIPWGRIDPFYTAVVRSVEEAVANALVVNTTMVGRDGNWTPALPHDLVRDRLRSERTAPPSVSL
jgi:L-aminopeptidase/D-esterase-like protein